VVTEPLLPDSAEDRLIDLPETRAVIEQAKGILMATYRCGPDEALDLLRRASQAGGLNVHMLAAKVVDLAKRGLTIADARQHKT
jgi:AmiR/NasT family two-component response regulator